MPFAHFNYIFPGFCELFRKFSGTCETRGHPGRAVLMKTCLEISRVAQTQRGVVCICTNAGKGEGVALCSCRTELESFLFLSSKSLQKYQGFLQNKSKDAVWGNKNCKLFLLCLQLADSPFGFIRGVQPASSPPSTAHPGETQNHRIS